MSIMLEQSHAAYSREVAEYARAEGLQPPEQAILRRLAPNIRGGRILDLGVGAGRTTPHLLALSAHYVGIDNCQDMVAYATTKFPFTQMQLGDARNLPFADGAFDLVFFSFNGIDHGHHAERLDMLREARRILRPGGWFVFSSHNRDYYPPPPPPSPLARLRALELAPLSRPRKVRRISSFALHLLRDQFRPTRQVVIVEEHPDYAIVSEQGLTYPVTYYSISLQKQIEQLDDAGFEAIDAFDLQGAPVTGSGCRDLWIYYCCRRAPDT